VEAVPIDSDHWSPKVRNSSKKIPVVGLMVESIKYQNVNLSLGSQFTFHIPVYGIRIFDQLGSASACLPVSTKIS